MRGYSLGSTFFARRSLSLLTFNMMGNAPCAAGLEVEKNQRKFLRTGANDTCSLADQQIRAGSGGRAKKVESNVTRRVAALTKVAQKAAKVTRA